MFSNALHLCYRYLGVAGESSSVHRAIRMEQNDDGDQEEYLAVDDNAASNWRSRVAFVDGEEEDSEEYLGVEGGSSAPRFAARRAVNVEADDNDDEYLEADDEVSQAANASREHNGDGDDDEYLGVAGGTTATSGPSLAKRVAQDDVAVSHPLRPKLSIRDHDDADASSDSFHHARRVATDFGADREVEFLGTIASSTEVDRAEMATNFVLMDRDDMAWPSHPPATAGADNDEYVDTSGYDGDDAGEDAPRALSFDPSAFGGQLVGSSTAAANNSALLWSSSPPARAAPIKPATAPPTSSGPRIVSADWRMSTVQNAFGDDDDLFEDNFDAMVDNVPPQSGPAQITAAMFVPTAGHRGAAAGRPSGRRLGDRLANAFGRKRAPPMAAAVPSSDSSDAFLPMTQRSSIDAAGSATSSPASPEELPPTSASKRRFAARGASKRPTLPGVSEQNGASERQQSPTDNDNDNVFVPSADRKSVRLASVREGSRGRRSSGRTVSAMDTATLDQHFEV